MSMLVRKGTMLHRNPSRRSTGRRASRGSVSRNKGESTGLSANVDKEGGSSSRNGSAVAEAANLLKSPDLRRGSPASISRIEMNTTVSAQKLTGRPTGDSMSPPDDFSRRTSSCTSQISGDERRQLYRYSKFAYESREYGSIMSQIREADIESPSGWIFTVKFFNILWKSALATAFLVILTIFPIAMAFIGSKYLHECPLQPILPLYFLIGGFSGIIALIWITYTQIQSRKYERCEASFFEEDVLLGSNSLRLMQLALCLFLLVWFGLGNSWIHELKGKDGGSPNFSSTLDSPDGWCSKELYYFSYAHLYIVYGLVATVLLLMTACFTVSTIRSFTHHNK